MVATKSINLRSITTKSSLQQLANSKLSDASQSQAPSEHYRPRRAPIEVRNLSLSIRDALNHVSVHFAPDPVYNQAEQLYQELKLGMTATSTKLKQPYLNELNKDITTPAAPTTDITGAGTGDGTGTGAVDSTDDGTGNGTDAGTVDSTGTAVGNNCCSNTDSTAGGTGADSLAALAQNLPVESPEPALSEQAADSQPSLSAPTIDSALSVSSVSSESPETSETSETSESVRPAVESPQDLQKLAQPELGTQPATAKRRRNNLPHRALRYNTISVQTMEQIMANRMLATALNNVLKVELDCFLGFDRYTHVTKDQCQPYSLSHDFKNNNAFTQKNLRNGFYVRNLSSQYGYVSIQYPRDRLCSFASHILKKSTSQLNFSEDLLLGLYTCSNHKHYETILRQLCDNSVTEGYIKCLARGCSTQFNKWRKHKLPSNCSFLCINNLCFSLQANNCELPCNLKPLQIWQVALGIMPNGQHKIFSINPLTANPSFASSVIYKATLDQARETGVISLPPPLTASLWNNLLNDLSNRGLSTPEYVCLDGALEALPHVLERYPQTNVIYQLIPTAGECRNVNGTYDDFRKDQFRTHSRSGVQKLMQRVGSLNDLIHSFKD